jgi:hypothetical protein
MMVLGQFSSHCTLVVVNKKSKKENKNVSASRLKSLLLLILPPPFPSSFYASASPFGMLGRVEVAVR